MNDKKEKLKNTNKKYREKIKFYDNYIVFVIDGYGRYYYTYNQLMQVTQGTQYSFWAYNIENAKALGYKAWN